MILNKKKQAVFVDLVFFNARFHLSRMIFLSENFILFEKNVTPFVNILLC